MGPRVAFGLHFRRHVAPLWEHFRIFEPKVAQNRDPNFRSKKKWIYKVFRWWPGGLRGYPGGILGGIRTGLFRKILTKMKQQKNIIQICWVI